MVCVLHLSYLLIPFPYLLGLICSLHILLLCLLHFIIYKSLELILLIYTENGHWDTSRALVRRTLEQCIHLGRQHRARNQKQDLYEAYRLLGQAVRPPLHFRLSYLIPLLTQRNFLPAVIYTN